MILGPKGVPCVVTHDGRTIRYPDPLIKTTDTVKVDIKTGKITDFIKFDLGNLAMVIGGRNMGRVGLVTRVRHHGSFDIVHVRTQLETSLLLGYQMCSSSVKAPRRTFLYHGKRV